MMSFDLLGDRLGDIEETSEGAETLDFAQSEATARLFRAMLAICEARAFNRARFQRLFDASAKAVPEDKRTRGNEYATETFALAEQLLSLESSVGQ